MAAFDELGQHHMTDPTREPCCLAAGTQQPRDEQCSVTFSI